MEETALNRSESVLVLVTKILEKIPFSGNLTESIDNIRSSMQALRPPRIMVMGRSRSGKSSLINAICGLKVAQVSHTKSETGQAQWKTYYDGGVELVRLLDTRGLQEADAPRQEDRAKNPFESLQNAIKAEYPDIILLVCKATDVHVAIQEDLNICESIIKGIKKIHAHNKLALIGVLTHCDQVAPPYSNLLGDDEDDQEKRNNIETFRQNFYQYIQRQERLGDCLTEIIPTCTYAKYEEGENGLVLSDKDYRWNIDQLIDTMMKYTPQERKGSLARMAQVKATQRTVAETIKTACVTIAGVVAANPIPGISIAPVLAIQTFMVMYIGWLSGRSFSEDTVKDFLVTSGVAVGANAGAIGLADIALKFLPVAGNIAAATASVTATQGIGDAAIAYFLKDK